MAAFQNMTAVLDLKQGAQSEKIANTYPTTRSKREVSVNETLTFTGDLGVYKFKVTQISPEQITFEAIQKYPKLKYWRFDPGSVSNPHLLDSKAKTFSIKLTEALMLSEAAAEFEGRKEMVLRLESIKADE